jgi:hypothetical protein
LVPSGSPILVHGYGRLEPSLKKIRVTVADNAPIAIVFVDSDNPLIRAHLAEVKAGKEYEIEIGGMPLAFRTYLFDWNGTTLHVFYLIWEDGNREVDPTILRQDWSGISRLQRVWFGQRNLGQQTLEIVLSGATSEEEARTTLQAELGKIVQIRS